MWGLRRWPPLPRTLIGSASPLETTVRRWLPLLLGEHALTEAEAEWNSMFSSLPRSAAEVPERDRLQWRPLPFVQAARSIASTALSQHGAMGYVDQIENPPVDPLTYGGRSYSV